ncbi:30S ribosomal protein S6 [Pontibacter brevis]
MQAKIKNHIEPMELKNYETVFILTPLLNDAQMQETVEKFRQVLKENGADIIHEENWGLRKLAYPIQKKSTGFYHLVEFKAPGTVVDALELAYRRDEKVVRFLTTALDKHAVAYNERRRNGEFKTQAKKEEVKA